MGQRGQFYWKWFKGVVWSAPNATDFWAGIIGIIGQIVAHFVPDVGALMTTYLWELPIWVFGAIVILRLFAVPFQIWKEDQAQIAALTAHGPDRQRLIIKNRLGAFLEEARELTAQCHNTEDAAALEARMNQLLTSAGTFIETSLGAGEAALFRNSVGTSTIYSASGKPNERLRIGMTWRMERLVQIIQRVDTVPINVDFNPNAFI
ncbi:hypothetical protein LCM4577_15175 [Mesorhizobium sp. LCM 4577]|uniref:hypothetical protein n=1 Tax=Mesorhizobium sp. LCM 4577 TaxID=1848288 RepID=UPI0008DA0E92|nr:hypothetical protein [Mesorhizobium sp. LCM 4577]OHV61037.1 hypothetical protein LCM4577_15175 [Mesorhizobium sp. LCM 4577]